MIDNNMYVFLKIFSLIIFLENRTLYPVGARLVASASCEHSRSHT